MHLQVPLTHRPTLTGCFGPFWVLTHVGSKKNRVMLSWRHNRSHADKIPSRAERCTWYAYSKYQNISQTLPLFRGKLTEININMCLGLYGSSRCLYCWNDSSGRLHIRCWLMNPGESLFPANLLSAWRHPSSFCLYCYHMYLLLCVVVIFASWLQYL